MFEIHRDENGDIILAGRFDAAQAEKARAVLDEVNTSCTVNFQDLKYISSAGLGELLLVQKRLMDCGQTLRLVNMNSHIRDIFKYAGFHTIFKID